jgi:hypothetical protein
MREPLSVNEAIDSLPELEGQDVTVEGLLRWEFECYAVEHLPKSERRESSGHFLGSSIWLEGGSGSLQFNDAALEKWNGKRVVVEGTLHAPDPKLGGCGHMSGWPASLFARTIERK